MATHTEKNKCDSLFMQTNMSETGSYDPVLLCHIFNQLHLSDLMLSTAFNCPILISSKHINVVIVITTILLEYKGMTDS